MLELLNKYYIIPLLGILGGLLLFLVGMKLMAISFEKMVSNSIRLRIHRLTSRKLIGVLIGVVMTALLQSSSATTLMIVGLVHGNLLSIYNAVPIIMGTNIGTTVTAQIVSYSIEALIPYMYIIGVLFAVLGRNKILRYLSRLVLSLALILSGMELLSSSTSMLQTSKYLPIAINYISNNNLLGLGTGMVFAAIVQSSSVGIAMLQVMASSKMISVATAIPIILGQNVGTCVDTFIGSLATNKAGKQAAIIHILFNIIGVISFYFFIDYLNRAVCVLNPNDPVRQIANAHTIFNIATTLILLPFSPTLVFIAQKIVKE